MKRLILGLIAFCFLPLPAGAEESASPVPADLVAGPAKGPWRRLFLDAMVVEQSKGLQRVFHPVRKYEGNPVLRADKPYETSKRSTGPYLYGTVLRDQERLRMWYHLIHQGTYCNAYAESTDAIHWTKPDLGLIEFDGNTQNNLFLSVLKDSPERVSSPQRGRCHNPSVIKQSGAEDPQKRYALFCYGADCGTARVAYSPDGLRWTFVEETCEKGLFPTSDVVNFFYDPYTSQYVATRKLSNRRGRAVGVAVSSDGLEWKLPVEEPVFVADDLDPDATQIYGMPVFPYQGLYIGLPWIYHARYFKYGDYRVDRLYDAQSDSPNTMDVQLAWSWDLVNWTRRRTPFVPLGEEGDWDSKMVVTARSPIVLGDRLGFYYGGFDSPHDTSGDNPSGIGLATLRLDGFCSMRAEDGEGWLISRREPMRTPRIQINARTNEGGSIAAEILDAKNRVLEGFSRKDCIPFQGDSVDHTLRWKSDRFPEERLEEDKKIRFFISKGELFSYLPEF